MKRTGYAAALAIAALFAVGAAAAETQDNPFRNAKVGDWIRHRMKTGAQGQTQEMTITMTLKAKTEQEATVAVAVELAGMKMPAQEQKIPLDEPYDIAKAQATAAAAGVKTEIVGQGEEKVSLGGKTYACRWIETDLSGAAEAVPMKAKSKIWICKDLPLSGLVKLETTMENGEDGQAMTSVTTMELVDSGRAP